MIWDLVVALLIGAALAYAGAAMMRRSGGGRPGLARRRPSSGGGSPLGAALVNFLYFLTGVIVSLFAPEIRAFLAALFSN